MFTVQTAPTFRLSEENKLCTSLTAREDENTDIKRGPDTRDTDRYRYSKDTRGKAASQRDYSSTQRQDYDSTDQETLFSTHS